tara:strand:+ start:18595 stop:19026 length:432 start_codon:yes stop_codon:yes gene_type:complete
MSVLAGHLQYADICRAKEILMNKEKREIARKLRVLGHAEETGQIAKTCRYFGVSRSSFYRWRTAFGTFGEAGLVNRPPIPKWHANRIPIEIEEKCSTYAASTTSAQCGSFGIWRDTMGSKSRTRRSRGCSSAMVSIGCRAVPV